MDKERICEELYSLPGGIVVRRRKSLVIPVAIFIVGAALIVLNNLLGDQLNNNMRSALVFIGGVAALVGLIMSITRLFGSGGIPFHRLTKSFLKYEELYYDRKLWHEVVECVNGCDVERLHSIAPSSVPAVAVSVYATRDGRFAAMQAYEYADLEYRPLTTLQVRDR